MGVEFEVNKEKLQLNVEELSMEKKLQFQNTINVAENLDIQNKIDLVTTIEKFEQNKEVDPELLKVTQELKIQQVKIESVDGSINELRQSKLLDLLSSQPSLVSDVPVLPGQQIDLSQLSLQRNSRNSISIDQSRLQRTKEATLQDRFASLQLADSTTEDVSSSADESEETTIPPVLPSLPVSSLPVVPSSSSSSSSSETPSFIPTGAVVKYLFGF